MSRSLARWLLVPSLSLVLLSACETAPEGVEGGDEGSDLSGIVMEKDQLAGELGKAQSISASEGQIKQQQAEFLELSQAFEARYGKRLDGVELTDGQANLLRTMLSAEQDVSLKGLLQALIDTHDTIDSLESRIDELKAQLPTPDIVGRGDSHLALATEYLTKNHGLDKKEADRLARRSLLTDNLAPGMEVWHFYTEGVYATTVTQGTAKVSPYFLNVRALRKLQTERDDAMALAASLEAEITVLEATRDQLRADLSSLKTRHEDLKVERDLLAEDKAELVEADETVYFHIDTARSLRQKDIITPAGIRLKDWRPELFTEKLDLRSFDTIEMFAQDFGTKRIRGIKLLPDGMWQEGRDYTVKLNESGSKATLQLDATDRFKNEAFVVVLK
jgi:cell division protein FtsB